eukprot:1202964-Pyramimonas_sp.AAC.1
MLACTAVCTAQRLRTAQHRVQRSAGVHQNACTQMPWCAQQLVYVDIVFHAGGVVHADVVVYTSVV